MAKKQGSFIEEHIEKAVLASAALAGIYILVMYVVRSPIGIQYDGKVLRPGQIDTYISEKAERLRQRLNGEPNNNQPYEPCNPVFAAMLNSSWSADAEVVWPAPKSTEQKIDRRYRMPKVPKVTEPAVEHIRAAAYIPKAEITGENADKQESYEPNDIDFVTVQGSFDLGTLADSFKECFAGGSLPEDWRDAGLARPVFAGVNLQRQRLGEDGQWGQWEDVPRAKIEPERELFKIIEDTNDLPSGGIMVRMLRFGDPARQASILQPEPYKIASAEEEWFPPALHKKYLSLLREKEMQDRRDAIIAAREQDQTKRPDRDRRSRTDRTPQTGVGGGGGGGEMDSMMRMMGGGGGAGSQPAGRPTRSGRDRRPETTEPARPTDTKTKTEPTIYEEFDGMLVAQKDLKKLREPIVLWANDDTMEPGNSYRYRIRLGVFNPVAGTGQVNEQDKPDANKVILWGEFSDVTQQVDIPRRLYFFPMNFNETAKAVDVQVCKYAMGYWHSEQFPVKRGEAIGKVAQAKQEPNDADNKAAIPDEIDYSTGAILVDVATVQDWTGGKNLQQRHYFEMLYSYDGTSIARMAAKLMNWPEELRAKYNEIKALEKKSKEPLREWSSASAFSVRRTLPGRTPTGKGGQPGEGSDEEMMRMMIQTQQQ